jgi:hypothetical protein
MFKDANVLERERERLVYKFNRDVKAWEYGRQAGEGQKTKER